MNRKEELLDTLRRSFDGDAWHGPAVRDAVEGITDSQAAHLPAGLVHNIWEVTLHIAAWANEVRRRLEGHEPGAPPEGDWPVVEGSYRDAVKRVNAARDKVVQVVEGLSEEDLDKRVGSDRDPSLGTGFTYAGIIEGLSQHNAYHAGQIMLLRRLKDV